MLLLVVVVVVVVVVVENDNRGQTTKFVVDGAEFGNAENRRVP
jgi:hypothetical protein